MLLSGNAPFVGESHPQIIEHIRSQPVKFEKPVWQTRSPEVQHLITCMLEKNFEKRITIPEIFEHPWVRGRVEGHVGSRLGVRDCLERVVRFKVGVVAGSG